LRGRDQEVEAIGDALGAAAAGRGGVLLFEGPHGIGKTRLLAEAREMARRVGVRALGGDALESQQMVPFAPLLDAMLGSDPPVGGAEIRRALGGDGDLRYWMLHDLQGVLESAAQESPLVLVLDDLQWADMGTLAALTALPSRLSGTPILWLFALQGGEGRAAMRDAMASLEREGARRLVLGRLPDDAVAMIVADVLEAEADPALLKLAANTRGNPFLLVELLRGLREEGRLGEEKGRAVVVGCGLPRRLTDSMRERLQRLSDEAQQAVTVAAALGPRFTAEQLASMLQRRPSTLVTVVAEALRADFLVEAGDRLGFRHDLVRAAVLESLPRSLRRALSREAATVLLDSGAAPAEVAMQLADGAEVGDRRAIAALREAARTLAGSDPAAAADLSVRALELLPSPGEQRGELVAEAISHLHMATRTDDARALGESELDGALSADEEAEVRLSLSALLAGSPSARAEENRRALELPGLTAAMRARHLALLAYHLALSGDVEEATSAAATGLAEADACADAGAQALATLDLALIDRMHCAPARAVARLEGVRGVEWSIPSDPWLAVIDVVYAHALADLGRCEEALKVVAAGVARGHRERNVWLVESWTQSGSFVRLMAGQLADACAEAESGRTTIEQIPAGDAAAAMGTLTLAEVALHTGDAARLKASVDAAQVAYESPSPPVRRHAVWVMVIAAIAREDWTDAVRWLYDDEVPYTSPVLPRDPGYQPLIARVALIAGDPELARRAVEFAETFDRESPGVAILTAIAAQTRGLVAGDTAELIDAATVLRDTQRPLLFASASEDAGRALARAGHARDAIPRMTDALDTYLELEATADARRVSRLLRDHGVRRVVPSQGRPSSGWGSLTDSELRVARLVAQGATNRDAADELFLSPHTVSTHLRHTFAKLGINSRIELTRIAIQNDATPMTPQGRSG
jgi:DNA-binding CsgD family transcriptional regulator